MGSGDDRCLVVWLCICVCLAGAFGETVSDFERAAASAVERAAASAVQWAAVSAVELAAVFVPWVVASAAGLDVHVAWVYTSALVDAAAALAMAAGSVLAVLRLLWAQMLCTSLVAVNFSVVVPVAVCPRTSITLSGKMSQLESPQMTLWTDSVVVTGKHNSNYCLPLSCNRKRQKVLLTNLLNN